MKKILIYLLITRSIEKDIRKNSLNGLDLEFSIAVMRLFWYNKIFGER